MNHANASQAKPLPKVFYKYTTRETARIVLQNRTLRWSTPALFNDPHDHQFDLHVDVDKEVLRGLALEKVWKAMFGGGLYIPHPKNLMGKLIQLSRLKGLVLSREEFEAEFGPAIIEGYENAMRRLPETHQKFREVIGTSKVLCQSEVRDSLLMWAYYAEQHKGAVLCFRSDTVPDSPWRVARPVQYQNAMPRLADEAFLSDMSAGLAVLDPQTLVDRVIYTKAAEWSHEQEWRLQAGSGRHSSASYEDVPFDARELDAVILGCVMPDDDRRSIIDIVRSKYPHASVLQATKNDKNFRLNIAEC
ncbi:MAG: DUF2971 domain-containing protein [Reyranella sp.]|uniref:DUF2971 domain-containing protein n=1 Tax=Reyranella sp. TaxID=1929291 RepID=UPI001ACE2AE9|nr:DUF2971 domain-containing protein [Reyranella sp.]MBN9086288.1 DUF2971 domain-containing protein [Reyranella sp.]